MATFNGARYIRNQILSLQQQTYADWNLWVRDDGSTDSTVSIVSGFASRDPRINLVSDGDSNLGTGANFFRLLKNVKGKYAIFCDQDDIWFEKKLETLVGFAEKNFDDSRPCLVYTDGHAYSDSEGIIVSRSISHFHARKLEEFLFFNAGYQGCSILFNHCMVQMADDYQTDFYMHDDIISLLGHVFGRVFFISKPLMLYRQHENNVTGSASKSLLETSRNFFRRNAYVISRSHYLEKKAFYNHFLSRLNNHNRRLFEQYLKYPEVPRYKRIFIVLSNGFSIGGFRLPLIMKTVLRRALQ